MKILTTNFLTCAVKACKSSPRSYPLHFKDATLERIEIDFNPLFVRNILPRVDWNALRTTANELGLGALVPDVNPVEFEDDEELDRADGGQEDENQDDVDMEATGDSSKNDSTNGQVSEETLRKLHNLLLETAVVEGKLCCENCGFEYPIKEGVGNFLLPAHLV